MINALRFVKGALKSTALAPELEHYQIRGGRVTGYNGFMALSSPIDLDLDLKPKATLMFKALEACGETVSLTATEDGAQLIVRSEKFTAYIPCLDHEVFDVAPTGVRYPSPPGLIDAMERLYPIISVDASRPWAMGLNVSQGSYYATNNISIVQIWDGHGLPTFNCPRFVVRELVRIKTPPIEIQVDKHAVTFHWDNGRWLRTQVLSEEWPAEMVDGILDRGESGQPLPEGFFEALEQVRPFVHESTNAVEFSKGYFLVGPRGKPTATYYVGEDLPDGPVFSEKILSLLKNEIDTIDFSTYPNPCGFRGPHSRGVVIGMSA